MNSYVKVLTLSMLSISFTMLSNIFDAARTGDVAALSQLINDNSDLINAEDHAKNTLLHIATHNNQPAIVTFLLNAGIEVLSQKNIAGNTALHLAAFIGNQQIANALLNAGINPYLKNNENKTAADIADEIGNHALANFIRTHKKIARPVIERE